MVFEGELAVKLQAKDAEVGTNSNRNQRQDQVTIGRSHSPGTTTTKALVLFLLGFSIMYQ